MNISTSQKEPQSILTPSLGIPYFHHNINSINRPSHHKATKLPPSKEAQQQQQ